MGWEKLNKPIIVGMDPGTTSSYAIIDTHGRTIKTKSAKELALKAMLSEITSAGTVIAIGADKKNCPSAVQKFAANTGARIILPREDLLVREKQELTKGKVYGNEHERDALASALRAYNELQPLLEKIDRTLNLNGQSHLKEKVTKMVISKNTSINKAIESFAKKEEKAEPEKPEINIEKHELIDWRIAELKKTNAILKKHNMKLIKALNRMKSKYRRSMMKKTDDNTEQIKKTIDSLWSVIREYKSMNGRLSEQISISHSMLSNLDGKLLLKKTEDLSWEECSKYEIKDGDILLVNNPNVFSEKAIALIKEKVPVIIHNEPISQKLRDRIDITLLSAVQFQMMQNEQFALVEKRQFEKQVKEANILVSVIDKYRKERAR